MESMAGRAWGYLRAMKAFTDQYTERLSKMLPKTKFGGLKEPWASALAWMSVQEEINNFLAAALVEQNQVGITGDYKQARGALKAGAEGLGLNQKCLMCGQLLNVSRTLDAIRMLIDSPAAVESCKSTDPVGNVFS